MTISQWQYFKRAEAHNTVLVDGQGDSEPRGPWGYQRLSRPRLIAWRSSPWADIAAASTDGFLKLQPPVSYERFVILIKQNINIVWIHDVLRCEKKRRYEWLLHLTPQQPRILSECQALQTSLPGVTQLDCRPAQLSPHISGPALRIGLYHDRTYTPQSGYWFPLQYGDLPAPVTQAPYAVWSQEASGIVTFDMVLSHLKPGQQPAQIQPLPLKQPQGVTAYQLVTPQGKVTVIFDDRSGDNQPQIQMDRLVLRGRVHLGNGKEWLSVWPNPTLRPR